MAEIGLDRIDEVRARTGATYRECYEALQASGGDVVQAVIALEERRCGWNGRLRGIGDRLRQQAQAFAREAARARIAVRQEGRDLFALPAWLGAVGAALLPGAAAAALLAAIATRSTVSLEREPAAG